MTTRDITLEAKTVRALLEMGSAPLRCALRRRERLRETPLVRLDFARTPPQVVLDRFVHEGLLTALPNGGVVATVTIERLNDVHEHGGEPQR